MKVLKIFLIAAAVWMISVSAVAGDLPKGLNGSWSLTEIIYKGERQPPLDPDLSVQWTFFLNGTARMYTERKNIPGFCERFSFFTLDEEKFVDEVFAVNPNNNPDCSKDPDMAMGRKVETRLVQSPTELLLDMQVGEEKITYVLTRPRCDFNSSMVISGRMSNPISDNCNSLPEPR